jgi:hypothetical protein
VAFTALKVIASHVDVAASLRVKELPGKIRVLHGFTAAPVEMALPAGFPGGVPDVFGHMDQIHLGIGHAGGRRRLLVGPGGVVTDQAVDPGLVGEIKGVVLPAVSCVT